MTPIQRALGALPHPATKAGTGWQARCPAHEDARASLSITTGEDGRVLLKCHAGCETSAIVAAIGLTFGDLFPPRDSGPDTIAALYDYRDEAGAVLYQVVRFAGKKFRQRRPDGAGGWIWRLDGTRRVLYRLPELKGHAAIFIAEGEKDAEQLRAAGLPATCNPHGAGKWRDDYTEQLRAAGVQRVCVLPDNDPPGEAHARQVARSCHDAGLTVRVLPLPGLPTKGDVSDWLTSHTREELIEAARACPLFDPRRTAAAGFRLELTSLADLLSEPEDAIEWIVQDRIPAGAIVLLAGKPKAGKSTLARDLSFSVAKYGESFLGWKTHHGAVWYLCFEDKRAEVRRHFRQMGADGSEPLRLFFDQAGPELLPALTALAAQEHPAVIVVDTLQRLIGAKDLNDYAEVTTRCAPLIKLARDTGATLVLVHHANKFGDGLDSILGSTALTGSVDNVFLLGRSERYRTLSSVQRIGPDLDSTVLILDGQTGRLTTAGSKADADQVRAAELMLDALSEQTEPVKESWFRAHVDCRLQDQVRGLRLLLRQGLVHRTGRGGKADPFMYAVANHDSCSHVPVRTTGTSIVIERDSSSQTPDLFTPTRPADAENLNNDGPDSCSREIGEIGDAEPAEPADSCSRDSAGFDSCSRAPEVLR